ncbi:beta-carotene 15,15'-dioxygenase, Brp/Blh family [Aquiluna borgnonia]|uniref:Probable beta-carotene 15,15'-dioxygenase n=1 Tax=Aquiluna borgnonia TaxID=2499157 RepID=A0A7D4Q5C4_9MICO|nr:beta-carotene 15,15'-dioxygenase, Brp/Blh family [Aquiluna borgnonia]QKJ25583.1 beta-carotene 15,15'-dioxygenase, Brp/Blh family [Aquiluna borgnonia]
MQQVELRLLVQLRTISRYIILGGTFISIPLAVFFPGQLEWQIVMALLALSIGIPHGAVDHLVSVPKMQLWRMAGFIAGYLAVTGLGIWFLLQNNLLGFQLIVLVSAIHFGLGDASFGSEIASRRNAELRNRALYAVAMGFTPVFIPLLVQGSTEALAAVNPVLIPWAGGLETSLLVGVIALNLVAMLVMALRRSWPEVIDLGLLLALSLIAPPLVAFALYFGGWHALRHTGRLALEFESSRQQSAAGNSSGAFWKAFNAGLPALALVLVFTVVLGVMTGFDLGTAALWLLLVVIWALTIPHMALTARLDFRALVSKP